VSELLNAVAVVGPVMRHQTPLAPFMVIIKGANRRQIDTATRHLARKLYGRLTKAQQKDFKVFARWFRAGGYRLPCALVAQ
jgi:ribosomal silencing factor RsfS